MILIALPRALERIFCLSVPLGGLVRSEEKVDQRAVCCNEYLDGDWPIARHIVFSSS